MDSAGLFFLLSQLLWCWSLAFVRNRSKAVFHYCWPFQSVFPFTEPRSALFLRLIVLNALLTLMAERVSSVRLTSRLIAPASAAVCRSIIVYCQQGVGLFQRGAHIEHCWNPEAWATANAYFERVVCILAARSPHLCGENSRYQGTPPYILGFLTRPASMEDVASSNTRAVTK